MDTARLRALMLLGVIVLVALVVLNWFEYGLAMTVQTGIMVPLVVLSLIDAGLIAYYFMHVAQLWRAQE